MWQYNNWKNLPVLRIRVVICEIRVLIYTFFQILGIGSYKKEALRKSITDSTTNVRCTLVLGGYDYWEKYA